MTPAVLRRGRPPATKATTAAPREAANGARAADLVADIFLIVLLAAPFLVFEVPGPSAESIIATRSAAPSIAAPAPPEVRAAEARTAQAN